MIEIDQVSYRYPAGELALDCVSLRIEPGERVVLLGANGCGKSTLLKLLNGLLLPDQGQIRFKGVEINRRTLRDRTWSRSFRQAVGLLFQHPDSMLFNPTVEQEIAYGLRHCPEAERLAVARQWAARVGFGDERLSDPPFRLSGGEKQRLCLAAVLALSPELLLMDEPTANLDPRATGWLVDFLLDMDDVATVVSTHNLSLAAELGERAIILSEQHCIVYDGPLDTALADQQLLWDANLAHRHRRHRGDRKHVHSHADWG